jgi:hypothetical protein
VVVVERHKSGRIHHHLVVVLPCDIRTGFDFGAVARGDYRSANAALRAEWAFWRRTAPLYGFGRTELLPVKSTSEGISKYVGKYLAKHHWHREEADKGARLVRYSGAARAGSTRFSFFSPKANLWRRKLAQFANRLGFAGDEEGFLAWARQEYGPKWAHVLGESIAREVVGIELRVGGEVVASTETPPASRTVPPRVERVFSPARISALAPDSVRPFPRPALLVWLPAGAEFPETPPPFAGDLSVGRPHGGRSSDDSKRCGTRDGPAP